MSVRLMCETFSCLMHLPGRHRRRFVVAQQQVFVLAHALQHDNAIVPCRVLLYLHGAQPGAYAYQQS